MAETTYTYDVATDLPDGKVNTTRLAEEIRDSSIVTALERVDTDDGTIAQGGVLVGGTLNVVFKDALSTGDKTVLDADTTNPAGGLLAAHNNAPLATRDVVLTPGLEGALASAGFGGRTVLGAGRAQGYIITTATASTSLRASSYFHQSVGAQRSVDSLSADDTSGGTGARKVKIIYYDGNMDGPFVEEVTLNGTTGVNTVATNIGFVDRMEISEVGSGGGNAGNVRLHQGLDATGGLIGQILIGDNRTFWCHHFVAQDRICLVTGVRIGARNNDVLADPAAGVLNLNKSNPLDVGVPQLNLDVAIRYDRAAPASPQFVTPITVTGPALVFATIVPDDSSNVIHYGAFEFAEVGK